MHGEFRRSPPRSTGSRQWPPDRENCHTARPGPTLNSSASAGPALMTVGWLNGHPVPPQATREDGPSGPGITLLISGASRSATGTLVLESTYHRPPVWAATTKP